MRTIIVKTQEKPKFSNPSMADMESYWSKNGSFNMKLYQYILKSRKRNS
jgi:hypothetical protein